jgi:hypothetical protein
MSVTSGDGGGKKPIKMQTFLREQFIVVIDDCEHDITLSEAKELLEALQRDIAYSEAMLEGGQKHIKELEKKSKKKTKKEKSGGK